MNKLFTVLEPEGLAFVYNLSAKAAETFQLDALSLTHSLTYSLSLARTRALNE